MKDLYPLPLLPNKLMPCSHGIYTLYLIKVSVVSYGPKDNSPDMTEIKIINLMLLNGLLSLTNPDSTLLLLK